MVDALDAVHVAGGDRVQRRHVRADGLPRRSARRSRASTASGQPRPLDDDTETIVPSSIRRGGSRGGDDLAHACASERLRSGPQLSRTTSVTAPMWSSARVVPRLDHLQHRMRGTLAQPRRVDGNAGQRRHVVLRLDHIVEADDGKIRAWLQVTLAQRQHRAERHGVVEAQRAGRRLGSGQGGVQAGHAAAPVGVALDHEHGGFRDAAASRSLRESRQAARDRRTGRQSRRGRRGVGGPCAIRCCAASNAAAMIVGRDDRNAALRPGAAWRRRSARRPVLSAGRRRAMCRAPARRSGRRRPAPASISAPASCRTGFSAVLAMNGTMPADWKTAFHADRQLRVERVGQVVDHHADDVGLRPAQVGGAAIVDIAGHRRWPCAPWRRFPGG